MDFHGLYVISWLFFVVILTVTTAPIVVCAAAPCPGCPNVTALVAFWLISMTMRLILQNRGHVKMLVISANACKLRANSKTMETHKGPLGNTADLRTPNKTKPNSLEKESQDYPSQGGEVL